MIFQAYRFRSVSSSVVSSSSKRVLYRALLDCVGHPLMGALAVPCGPCRSSFSSAMDDVRHARKIGYTAFVRSLNSTNQL